MKLRGSANPLIQCGSVEQEQQVLGRLLIDNRYLFSDKHRLTKESFEEPLHRRIFELAEAAILEGRNANPVTLKTQLPQSQTVGDITISQYLARLASEAVGENEVGCGSSEWVHGLEEGMFALASSLESKHEDYRDSPIERMFLCACDLLNLAEMQWFDFGSGAPCSAKALVFPQEKIANYRVDFLILGTGDFSGIDLVIECDGHNYHERDATVATRDRVRDRDLQAMGYSVLRFTGRELFNRSFACASEVALFMIERSKVGCPAARREYLYMASRLKNYISFARYRTSEART
jgi:very-short-patch-repair endonuclease